MKYLKTIALGCAFVLLAYVVLVIMVFGVDGVKIDVPHEPVAAIDVCRYWLFNLSIVAFSVVLILFGRNNGRKKSK